jgi:hypothetical protein
MLAEELPSVIGRRATLAYVVRPNVARVYARRGTDRHRKQSSAGSPVRHGPALS